MPGPISVTQSDFVLDREFREGQKECIDSILNAFHNGKQFAILEAPTGSGKSAIALTISRFFNSSFYVTVQKFLQSQIMNDFGNHPDLGMVDLRGRANYGCTYWENNQDSLRATMQPGHLDALLSNPPDCSMGFCRRQNRGKCEACFPKAGDNAFQILCPYYDRVEAARFCGTALMNYANFILQMTIPDRWLPRDLLILDEGHQLEGQLLDHISVALDSITLSATIPDYEEAVDYLEFIINNKIAEHLTSLFQVAVQSRNIQAQDKFASLIKKVREFEHSITSGDEWVCEFSRVKNVTSVLLKPVYVRNFAHSMMFNHTKHVLIMSATILDPDVYMSSLGIAPEATYCYRMRNRFPVENRPIFFQPTVSVTGGKAKQPYWGPKVVQKVDELIAAHPDERGIVHTHNYAITKLLAEGSQYKSRMLFQADFSDKEELLAEHAERANSVIVAPAMHEGLDLIDDLSRFQIICKVPYPNFMEDKQLARRMDDDPRYYTWLTALKICQSVGRSVRSGQDWAVTYIIDEAFDNFQFRAKNMLPIWFREVIINGTTDAQSLGDLRSQDESPEEAFSEAPF